MRAVSEPDIEHARGTDALWALRALSVVLDLANGVREDKSLATALFAHALALRSGGAPEDARDAFYAALLRHVGCTSYAHREAELVLDDVVLRRELGVGDSTRVEDVARALTLANDGSMALAGPVLASLAEDPRAAKLAWTTEACGGAEALARAMGLGAAVSTALTEVFERFDGQGAPRGLHGERISRVGRIATVAHTALVHRAQRGAGAAEEVLGTATRTSGACDPSLAAIALDVLAEHPAAMLDDPDGRLSALEPALALPELDASRIAEAFGDFADLQSRHTRGHARGVASLVLSGAEALGLGAAETRGAVLAAHLHDVGTAAVPTRLWETSEPWSAAARERARSHAYYGERVLSLSPALREVAAIAGAHHERLDGSGYHRGASGDRLPIAARLLAASDVMHALLEARPHRAALARPAARDVLRALAKEGALDPRCVDAIAGGRPRARAMDPLASLTAREREVLQLVARGRTNKEIASALGISDRTVQTHTLHVYEKLGVDTRAAAAIAASRAGLLDP